ncbi:MAG TPA: T9SS type A sorting domain-containing protein, partial [Ignavibacteriaceae bacterium]|nr:T9SS type A sorting domain-containing protein [Ignavibacteriaceae bacterium]
NQGFEIQKKQAFGQQSSVSDQEWSVLGFVNGNGTTTEPQTYSFVDEGLQAGKYQYRLKQIDFDGTFEYSNTIEVEINSPTKFSLEQNYPNPFNPSTRIKFTIPFVETHLPAGRQGRDASLLTTLKVFDVLGNEIATLVNEEKPAGNFEVEFSVGASRRLALTSGIYFYQLKAGNFIETKKMTLLK